MSNNNTGHWNTGYRNTGDCNTGYRNTGYRNTGNCNTGYWNTGYRNTGNCNTGNCNTGYWNTGYRNTGDWNTGDCNTGYWNTGDCNTGYCNTVTPDDCLIFNKPAKRNDWVNADKPSWLCSSLTEWIDENNMSDKEKDVYPSYATTGGYLKAYKSLHEAYKVSWDNATPEDRAKTFKLPNFDIDVFMEVFGFDPREDVKRTIIVDGKEIAISEESFQAFKEQFKGE